MEKVKSLIINTLLGLVLISGVVGFFFLVALLLQFLGMWSLAIIFVMGFLWIAHDVGQAILKAKTCVEK